MASDAQRAELEPQAPWRLSDALNDKLADLQSRGTEVLWIECCREDLTALVIEGGEAAIRLDPDPSQDRAWYGDVEIRHSSTRLFTWVFVRGDDPAGEPGVHIVSPPDPPEDQAPGSHHR